MRLGRLEPPDWGHVAKYPLAAAPPTAPVPVAVGVNWYVEFDHPVKDSQGTYWVAKDARLSTVRGGHCVCLEPVKPRDTARSWWDFYDQGQEGACEGFGHSRMMSLLNRRKYDAFWLYDEARKLDGRPNEEGTTNRSALEVLRVQGHRAQLGAHCVRGEHDLPPSPAEGIAAYRWASSVDEILSTLGTPRLDHVVVLNSWGRAFPHRVCMPANVLARLLRENGEAGVVTDR